MATATQAIGNLQDANFPVDPEGRTYHVQCKKGEAANRILLVGDPDRATLLKDKLFDKPAEVFQRISNRGFITYTGNVSGKLVTIMSVGMGMPMKDFAIREIRSITKGDLAIIRLGSCGTPQPHISIKTVVAANSSFSITTDSDAVLAGNTTKKAYRFSNKLQPDQRLHELLTRALQQHGRDNFPVVEGGDATADSFYSSQGRLDPEFADANEELTNEIQQTGACSLQMETYHMFYLAAISNRANDKKSKTCQTIHAAACAIVLANRIKNEFLDHDSKHKIEIAAGRACIDALLEMPLKA